MYFEGSGRLISAARSLCAIVWHLAIGGTVTSTKFKFSTLKYYILATEEASFMFFQINFMKVSILLLKFNSRG